MDWWWVAGQHNVADIVSRGVTAMELKGSQWFGGPSFMKGPITEWPISQACRTPDLPERNVVIMAADMRVMNETPINVTRFSNFDKLLRVTAIIRGIFKRKSFRAAYNNLLPKDLDDAESFWIRVVQRPMVELREKDSTKFYKVYGTLGPKLRDDGMIVVGDRVKNHVHFSHDNDMVILLPNDRQFSRLYAEKIHREGHNGVSTTMAKIRSKFWIVRLKSLVSSIRYRCVQCRRFEGKTEEQCMGPLPMQRLQPSPPWTYVGCDLFGPFRIKGEVQKRTQGKVYGVIFNCLVTRAIHLDLAVDCSEGAMQKVFRRFTSIRGYPMELFTDHGSQLAAMEETLRKSALEHRTKWTYSTPDAPWQNGVTESLIKGVKKSLFHAIGEQVLLYEELQTLFFEVSDLLNSRPIGQHPTKPEEGKYLCPNDLLIGRSSKIAPGGPWNDRGGHARRLKFMQYLVEQFWNKWTQSYFTSLIVKRKWHTEHRNLKVGDIVIIQEEGIKRGKWKTGIVEEAIAGADGKVRNVVVRTTTATGIITKLKRAIQRLVLLLPAEDK
ncbi:uncharacterized protein LOC117105613 [Anneissia japonica]|uniref:uncharacterized protein LOC117105613 n=1 Tax=Anneissia japonica TaxID=1529436 RepID=UPI0014255F28|nr:uncharacterized protein LOC117105613 [Anneissia japonica]